MEEKDNKIQVLVKRVGGEPALEFIDNDFRALQKLIGGHFEMPQMPGMPNVNFVIHGEGKLIGLEPNVNYYDDVLCGTVVAVGNKHGESVSLTDKQLEMVREYFDKNTIKDPSSVKVEDYINTSFISFKTDEEFWAVLDNLAKGQKNSSKTDKMHKNSKKNEKER